jgi:ElaB/YqjD/DUF883 family membrane-anchored ribosome-binding protein
MATATTTARSTAASTRRAANGTSRQIKSVSRRAASEGQHLQAIATREARALTQRAGQMITSATRATREHPWTAVGIVAAAGALVGGLLWARNR